MQPDDVRPEDGATLSGCAFCGLFLAVPHETDILTVNHIHNPSTRMGCDVNKVIECVPNISEG
ncbi:MAG: hypothetical protein ACYDH4_09740, partial [Candidatus Cryosericum sp.]